MDISKLSRHTKKAKKLIAQALFSSCPNAALSKFKPQKKKININISSLGEIKNTIDRILSNGGTNVPLKIEVDKVVEYICGKDGAAKILADSMLTKNKKNKENEAGFKNLVSKTLETLSEDSFNDEKKNKDIRTKMRSYIQQKKRGVLSIQYGEEGSEAKGGSDREEGSEAKSGAAEIVEDSKDAREIDWLKLLCALIVLYVAETTITEKQIHDANEFIRERVTEITKTSTTFYKLKSEFETILQIAAILQKDAVLQPLLKDIEECLNKTYFVSIPIKLFLKANESLFSSIDKSTSDVLIGFFNKAQELAKKLPVVPIDTLQLASDIDEEQIDGANEFTDKSKTLITEKQIGDANKFIKEKVTAITETSTTFYELKRAFEAILQSDAKKLSILQPLLKDIGIRLNDTTFVPVSIEFLIVTNKLPCNSIYKDTATALSNFLEKAKELAKKPPVVPTDTLQLMMSDIDKGREEQLIRYLKDEIKIEKIRTVGNVNDKVTKKYVISKDGTELIIYPFLENKGFLDVVKYLCKIGDDSIKDIDCLGEEHRFPESESYNNIDECPVGLFKPDLLNAKTREILLLKWEDFLDKKLICVNSKDEYKTYGQIIGMSEDARNQFFGELYKIEELRQEVKKK